MSAATDALAPWRHNIYLIPQMIQNDVSSTKVGKFLLAMTTNPIFRLGPIIPSSGAKCAVPNTLLRH